jgi:hypothetical protein
LVLRVAAVSGLSISEAKRGEEGDRR